MQSAINENVSEKTTRKDRQTDNRYGILWIFISGGLIGYGVETVWCYYVFGEFSSRSSDLFFPFSIVWAMGTVLVTLFFQYVIPKIFHAGRHVSALYIFLTGSLFCGIFEFACGFGGEKLFEMRFWDYSKMPLHIGRYVDVMICLLWGLGCVLWIRRLLPVIRRGAGYITGRRIGRIFTIILTVYIIATSVLSGMALHRMNVRSRGDAAETPLEIFLDDHFKDEDIWAVFPKMHLVGSHDTGNVSENRPFGGGREGVCFARNAQKTGL